MGLVLVVRTSPFFNWTLQIREEAAILTELGDRIVTAKNPAFLGKKRTIIFEEEN